MTPIELNNLHMEYRHRFRVEFDFLVQQYAFATVVFQNSECLFEDDEVMFSSILSNLFTCSFEGMALGLTRLWDERRRDKELISIPNLVNLFHKHSFLGCYGLQPDGRDRKLYDTLQCNPLRQRLRVVRTEALAHSIFIGTSRDRTNSDIYGKQKFGLANGEVIAFCSQTLELLFSLISQLHSSSWHSGTTLVEMLEKTQKEYADFLSKYVNGIHLV